MGVPIPMAWLLLALSPAGAQQANSTASWMTKRTGMITAALGTDGTLPQRSTPDHIVEGVAPGVNKIVWDLTDKRFFEITSSVFYAPKSGDPIKRAKHAFLFHHGRTCNRLELPPRRPSTAAIIVANAAAATDMSPVRACHCRLKLQVPRPAWFPPSGQMCTRVQLDYAL